MSKKKSSSVRGLFLSQIVFFALAFLLLAVREGDWRFYALAAGWPCLTLIGGLLFPSLFRTDRMLGALTLFFAGLLLLLTAAYALSQLPGRLIWLGFGLLIFLLSPSLFPSVLLSPPCGWGAGLLAAAALGLKLVWPGSYEAGPVASALLLIPLGALMSRRSFLPVFVLSAAGLSLLLLNADWASALVFGMTFSLLLFLSSGSYAMLLAGLLESGGLWGGFMLLFPPLALSGLPRLSPAALASAFSGGLFGTGLGLGSGLPAESASGLWPLLLAGEQFGLIFLVCLPAILALLLARMTAAASSSGKGPSLFAMGSILLLGLRGLLSLAACVGWIPLPSFGFPLLSTDPATGMADFFLAGAASGLLDAQARELKEDARLAMLAR